LEFCNNYFKKIIIWAAGEKCYVEEMVNILFNNHRKPDLILTRENITNDGVDYHKPLSVVCQSFDPPLDKKLLIFVDDREKNFKEDMGNGISIPPFQPKSKYSFLVQDRYLIDLINWFMLDETRYSTDVRKLDKSRIFL
jgi:hypothetical protein